MKMIIAQYKRKKVKSLDKSFKGSKKGAAEMKRLKTKSDLHLQLQQHNNNNKHKYKHVYGRGQFQLFPFFSDVCSG